MSDENEYEIAIPGWACVKVKLFADCCEVRAWAPVAIGKREGDNRPDFTAEVSHLGIVKSSGPNKRAERQMVETLLFCVGQARIMLAVKKLTEHTGL